MTRVLAILALLAAGAGAIFLTTRGEGPPEYRVVLDNAFGLIEGADLKVAGVRAGAIQDLDVEPRGRRALVTFTVERPEFGSLRRDAFCEVKPQSLIGEYFLDCRPGTSPRRLPEGGTIPVEQTASTVPADLVANVMRLPPRERLRIVLTELGVTLAARGGDVNQTIRRAVPALRETNRVLAILADNRRVLRQLTRDADTVLAAMADRRTEVTRFVAEARDAARVSAQRDGDLAESIRLLPGFLRELRPALADLGTAAREQTPALRDLRAAAPALETFLERLGPFAEASRPAVRSLGAASRTGRRAVRDARPTVAELRRFAGRSGEVGGNLATVLQHLDDRRHAVEPDPRSPGGRGYTGLEALLQYPFDQSLAINIFDDRGYWLKLNALFSECGSYTNAQGAKEDPGRRRRCSAALGPSAPGITSPDPTAARSGSRAAAAPSRSRGAGAPARRAAGAPTPTRGSGAAPAAPARPGRDPGLESVLAGLLGGTRDEVARALGPARGPAPAAPDPAASQDLLGYLLGP